MRLLAALCFLLATGPAAARDAFDARVQRAKSIERSPDGKAYQQILWRQVGRYGTTVMQQCLPKGVKPDVDFFILVGDVMPDHSLSRIEVRPLTKLSMCFAEGIGSGEFPSPPDRFGASGMPIEMDMRMRP
jgi:hypothetical protein